MKISRDRVVELLRQRGHFDRAAQAERTLPAELDADKDSAALTAYGVAPLEVSDADPNGKRPLVNRQHLVRGRILAAQKPPAT